MDGRSNEHYGTREGDRKLEDKPIVTPTSLPSWFIGVAQGDTDKTWLQQQIETEIFKKFAEQVTKRTGVDFMWLVAALVAMHSARTFIPSTLRTVLRFFQTQATSSITLSPHDALQKGLRNFVRKSTVKTNNSWLNVRGRHEERDINGELQPIVGSLKQMFLFNDTLFILDEANNTDTKSTQEDDEDQDADAFQQLTVRCFGHSNEPINELLDYIGREVAMSEQLDVVNITVGSVDQGSRDKRPLSSIDMEPEMMKQIQREVEDFFHEDSKALYRATNRPYRHGFLLSGPPGTGKTSLSVAISSHAGVQLAIINLQNMDDEDLKAAFDKLPIPCVVLLEDIDASSADVGNRALPVETKLQHLNGESETFNKRDAVNLIDHSLGVWQEEFKAQVNRFEATNQMILQFMEEHVADGESQDGNWSDSTVKSKKHHKSSPVIPGHKKSVTLSGLLNTIDGADAVDGRLLIMTTNHPEKLDPALTRAGRCDSRFHIGYATKNSAEQTFKRIFGSDPCKLHQSDTIDRFAKAFKEQFPANSQIPTCDLAKYCGQYRNRPVKAVQDFPEWLRVGDDMFAYAITDASSDSGDIAVNEAQPFNPALLNVGPEDFVPVVTKVPIPRPQRPADVGFSVDDVEHDEWPEHFGKFFSFFCPCPTPSCTAIDTGEKEACRAFETTPFFW